MDVYGCVYADWSSHLYKVGETIYVSLLWFNDRHIRILETWNIVSKNWFTNIQPWIYIHIDIFDTAGTVCVHWKDQYTYENRYYGTGRNNSNVGNVIFQCIMVCFVLNVYGACLMSRFCGMFLWHVRIGLNSIGLSCVLYDISNRTQSTYKSLLHQVYGNFNSPPTYVNTNGGPGV